MNQSNNFVGQHLFCQILSLVDKADLRPVIDKYKVQSLLQAIENMGTFCGHDVQRAGRLYVPS